MSAEQAAPGAPRPGGIPLCVPELSGNEWAYTRECLDTGWVSSAGPFVDRFEREMEAALGGGLHAVATASGTAALHLALIGAGVRPDDEVLVSALTFIAPANTIRYVGARPVFVDAEPTHWQMDVDQVRAFLEDRCESGPDGPVDRATGRRIGAIVPVHILGHPVDMAPLLQTAARFGVPVVEDATESLGARYQGRAVGSLGQFGCLSFNGNKMLTTGGGGMLLTPDAGLARQARHLSTQA
jgi:perosamine synthetase